MIGDLIYNQLVDSGRLPCTGNAYPISFYPELAVVCANVGGTAPPGYFYVPMIPMQKESNIDYPVLIQAEQE